MAYITSKPVVLLLLAKKHEINRELVSQNFVQQQYARSVEQIEEPFAKKPFRRLYTIIDMRSVPIGKN